MRGKLLFDYFMGAFVKDETAMGLTFLLFFEIFCFLSQDSYLQMFLFLLNILIFANKDSIF